MPRHKKRAEVHPSAYPGARLDSSTWRSVLRGGASLKKANAVVPHASTYQTASAQGPSHARAPSSQSSGSTRQQHDFTFLQNFGLLGVPMLGAICVAIGWTTVLLVLNVGPNATANYVMDTAEFDDGRFWRIVDPNASYMAASSVGLGLVLAGYIYTLLKMTWWQNDDLPDSNSKAFIARLMHMLVRDSTRRDAITTFLNDLTGFQGKRRKFWVRTTSAG